LSSARLPPGSEARNEAERREKWASYYSTNSAALAHYHLGLSQGGQEPAIRPQSPPAPPQLSVAASAPRPAPVAAAPSGASVAAIAMAAPVSAVVQAPRTKKVKKSRWGGKTDEDNEAVVGKNSINGKSDGADASKSLYLNKFVQEKSSNVTVESSCGDSEKDHSYYGRPKDEGTNTVAGTKRKVLDRHDSSFSATSDNYYGPATGALSSGRRESNEADSVPLGLTKKEKKALKKMNSAKAAAATSPKPKVGGMKSDGFVQHERALANRAYRFQGKGGINDVSSVKSTVENVEKYMGKTVIGGLNRQLSDVDYERMTVKGTCKILEKEYLRLTSPPRPELVRPQPVLEKHLANLKKSWKKRHKNDGGVKRDYNWYCSQFKAIRQDLTVQRIFNAFAVEVYETHAKIALEEDDINEYNQSQTQLKELYDSIHGHEDKEANKGALKNMNEFVAYRIIYYVFLSGNKKYDGGSSDIFKIMLKLTQEQRNDPFIRHALQVRAAVADNDYHKFFALQDNAPTKTGCILMDKIVPSIRKTALERICKAYRPNVCAFFVLKEMGFDVEDKNDYMLGKEWMESCGCKFDGEVFLTKDSVLKESTLGVKNSLI